MPHGAGDPRAASAHAPGAETPDVLRRGPRRGGGFAQSRGSKRLRTLREGVMPVSADRPQTGDRPPNASGTARSSPTNRKGTFLSSQVSLASGRPGRRWLNRRMAVAMVAGIAATGATGAAIVAEAAPPAFPNNVVVFPDRDFVTIEGYQNHIGEEGKVEVTRR